MSKQPVIFTQNISESIDKILSCYTYDKLFILTDRNTFRDAFPLLVDSKSCSNTQQIVIEADDTHKNIEALTSVWKVLSDGHATRRSFMINLGGGMVTDLGGFAASTFKRGIRYINVPTTLLGAVDAAVGGKTGINFNGLKNEIGVFNPAEAVLISSIFFKTLSREHLLSGYAEMLKHGLISSIDVYDKLLIPDFSHLDLDKLLELLEESVKVKEHIVEVDPFEKNIRKSLNLGHTIGHAFESLSLKRQLPVQHGYAVAWGLICELLLSHMLLGFPVNRIRQLSAFIADNYGTFSISCNDYDYLYERMTHDKKNESDNVNFTLLKNVGIVEINQTATKKEIYAALDLYRDIFHL
ncbi:3-dehydroquinate synthase [Coprobacter sp.]